MSVMTLKQARRQASEGACHLVELAEDMEHLRVGEHVWVVPELLDGGPNVRSTLPEDGLLVASVGEIGVQQEILAYPTLTGLVVLDGHRRLDAARRAGLEVVPVRVVDGTEGCDAAERTHRQLVLNDTAEHVSTSDRARALALFSASGMPKRRLRQIASDEEVSAAVSLKEAESSVEWMSAQLPSVSLVELAQVAEIAADPDCPVSEEELIENLARAPWRIAHELERWRQDVERLRVIRQTNERLVAQGLRVLSRDEYDEAMSKGGDNRMGRVGALVSGEDARRLDPEEHKTCPGRVVFTSWDYDKGEPRVSEFCLAPLDHGHLREISKEAMDLRRALKGQGAGPEAQLQAREVAEGEDEAARAKREERERLQAASQAAREVRRRFVERVLAVGRLSTVQSNRLAEWAMARVSAGFFNVDSALAMAGELWGAGRMESMATTSGRSMCQPRLWLIALAMADAEDREFRGSYWEPHTLHTLRKAQKRMRDYLLQLTDLGYELSEPERLFLERLDALEAADAEGEAS